MDELDRPLPPHHPRAVLCSAAHRRALTEVIDKHPRDVKVQEMGRALLSEIAK